MILSLGPSSGKDLVEVWHHSLTQFAFPIQDYSSLNYLDIVVDATLSLINSPENIGLKPEKLGTKVNLDN